MDNIQAPLLNTTLVDRVLWYDGVSAYSPAVLLKTLSTTPVTHVTELTPAIVQYNDLVPADEQIKHKVSCDPFEIQWTTPEPYRSLDVVQYVFNIHSALFSECSESEIKAREYRLAQELALFNKHSLQDVLRTVIWIINTLTVADIVWGVGRGSSVSSYVLYVIGVHDVDSYTYELDIDDFLHE